MKNALDVPLIVLQRTKSELEPRQVKPRGQKVDT